MQVPFPWDSKEVRSALTALYPYKIEVAFDKLFDRLSLESASLKPKVMDSLIDCLHDSKSPGSPMVFVSATNKVMKDSYGNEFRSAVNARVVHYLRIGKMFWEARKSQPELFATTHPGIGLDMLEQRIIDPVLLKIKGEPRKLGKAPRLVCMVSAIAATNERIALKDAFFDEQERPTLPTAVALDLVTESELERRAEKFASWGELASSDVQGWEYACSSDTHFLPFAKWAICLSLVDDEFEIVPGKEYQLYYLFAVYIVDYFRILETPAGQLISMKKGVVTSGRYGTFSDSSCKRAFLAFQTMKYAFCMDIYDGLPNQQELALNYQFGEIIREVTLELATRIQTAGDDCLHKPYDPTDLLFRYGFVITDYKIMDGVNTPHDFCSTSFQLGNCHQQNIEKFFVGYMFTRSTMEHYDEIMVGFTAMYLKHPLYGKFWELLRAHKTA